MQIANCLSSALTNACHTRDDCLPDKPGVNIDANSCDVPASSSSSRLFLFCPRASSSSACFQSRSSSKRAMYCSQPLKCSSGSHVSSSWLNPFHWNRPNFALFCHWLGNYNLYKVDVFVCGGIRDMLRGTPRTIFFAMWQSPTLCWLSVGPIEISNLPQ